MWSGIWSVATTRIGFWAWIWAVRHCGMEPEATCWFQCWGNITSLFLWKNNILRCWGWHSLLNWIGAITLSILLKLPPRKLEPWFILFLFSEVVLHFYKSTIRPCMEYCCHVWVGAPSCYLELLDKLQKQICRSVGPSLAAFLEPLAHCRNVASLDIFYRYYFCKC